MQLKDKVIVITGAGEGLGRCLALKLSEHGARLVLIGRSEAKLREVEAQVCKVGGTATAVVCDIRDSDSVQRARQAIEQSYPAVDILVNNAGVWTDDSLEQVRPELRRNAFETNSLGTIEFTEALVPLLKRPDSASILNVISTSGLGHTSGSDSRMWKSYAASKWAVTGYTKALRESLAGSGVKVLALFPGGFESNSYQNAGCPNPHNQPWMMKTEEVADVALFMLSSPSSVVVEEVVLTKFFGKSV